MEVLVMFTIVIKMIGSIILLNNITTADFKMTLERIDFCYGLFQLLYNLHGLAKKNMCEGTICKYVF